MSRTYGASLTRWQPSGNFPLGQTVATPGALALLVAHGMAGQGLLARHARGDWGEIGDAAENERALRDGERLVSSYRVGAAEIWIITEADRSVTTILRPEDY